MRLMYILLVLSLLSWISIIRLQAQEGSPIPEQQLENQVELNEAGTEDDAYLQQLEHLKKYPLNLNEVTADELKELIFLTALQIDNFISYRNLLGKLISVYELQAVPGWDVATIKRVLSYATISNTTTPAEDVRNRFAGGDHHLLIRYSQTLERSEGFAKPKTGTTFLGGRDAIFFRYRYQYRNLLQYGIVGDKDAGEQFFQGTQRYGFDFYSAHLFMRRIGHVKAFAVGDFTVNMGQGLIQWQGLAFKKSAEVMSIKRQSPVLCPYNSAGEFYFHRGVGLTVNFGKWEASGYTSIRRLSANIVSDTVRNKEFITSFLNSGYHRTQGEDNDRNGVRQVSFGSNAMYKAKNWHIAFNGVMYNFSLPLQKRNEPYNLYAINGKSWGNLSIDYSCTYHNVHVFGEAAIDKNLNRAFLNGLLISVDPRVDIAILQRTIGPAYQALYGNAFTENASPTNENGLYTAIAIRPPIHGLRLDVYVDSYKFPWLKYLVDAPSLGSDFVVQVSYNPSRQVEVSSRYRSETKESNWPSNASVTNQLVFVPRQGWRTQFNYQLSSSIVIRNRVELAWYNRKKPGSQNGFLTFFDVIYNPPLKRFSTNVRLQYFETDGYDTRVYAYENDVMYSYSVPAFFDEGYRYYLNFSYTLKRNLSFWIHWTQLIFANQNSVGAGLDQINANHRSEIKLQCEWVL